MIETEIKQMLAKQFGLDTDKILPNLDLVNDLNADSLDIVEITMSLESKYKIAIEDNEADSATTLQKLVELVSKKIQT